MNEINMDKVYEYAKAAYASLLPKHTIELDTEYPRVVDITTGIYIVPITLVRNRVGGTKEIPGYGVSKVVILNNYPDAPDDERELELSAHQDYHKAVRNMLMHSFKANMDIELLAFDAL